MKTYGLIMLQETISSLGTHSESGIQRLALEVIGPIKEVTEIASAVLIALGVAAAIYNVARLLLSSRRLNDRERHAAYRKIRLKLSRFLAVALEFQLAADLLATTIAPSWEQIGKLGAVAVIRTFLNYFLEREMKDTSEE